MSRLKKATAVTAGMACVAALAAGIGFTTASASTVTVVKPSSMSGWSIVDDNGAGGGSVTFVGGPATAPAGAGSLRFQLNTATAGWIAATPFTGVRLDTITALGYDTYRSSDDAGDNLAVALQLNVDYDLTDAYTGFQGRLVYEPYQTSPGGVPEATWQHWNAFAGQWWQTANPANPARAPYIGNEQQEGPLPCPQANPCSTDDLLTAYPDLGSHATLGALILKAGSGWSSFDGNADNLTVGVSGADTIYDFEPETACTTVCYVDAASGNDAFGGDTPASAKKTIQAAIDQVNAGGQVRVLPGSYNETASSRDPASMAGAATYQFGLFFPAAKPGITLMGVTSTDDPITDAGSVQATITTNATNNFGHSGTFVEADDTTIRGVELGPNTPGNNKTVEVVADGFTLRDVDTSVPGGGAVYISEFDAPAGPVDSYDIRENLFDDGTQIAISSGAGLSGPVTGRQIVDNTFAMDGAGWPGVSFNGAGGVPWYTKDVGGAIIQGNTFSGSTQYIRSRGTVVESEFDWESYWNDNTFDRAVVALVTEVPFDVRAHSYTSSGYTFTNVRRIGAVIQDEIGNALAGDTVLVKDGTYPEDVVVNKANLTLKGAGIDASTIVGTMGDATVNTVEIPASAPGVTVEGFTITRAGNAAADWNGALNNQGVAIYGDGSTLRHSEVTGNRNGVYLNDVLDVSIVENVIDSNRTGIHVVRDVSGLTIRNNFVTDNWTMGLLFRNEPETDPNPTAGVSIVDNDISGNWYSQVEARAYLTSPPLDLTRNWFGTTSPTVVAAPTSGEPPYSTQIPVEFGGAAEPPAGSPTIVWNPGTNPANPVDYVPFQCSGTDTSTALGFQPLGALSSETGYCMTFSGFFQPVDNNAVNVVKAGQTVPVKWRLLAGDTPVSDPASFVSLTSVKVSCTSYDGASDLVEEVTSGSSGLQYLDDGYWQFNWKTAKGYKGTCRTMTVTLADGTTHSAQFQFK